MARVKCAFDCYGTIISLIDLYPLPWPPLSLSLQYRMIQPVKSHTILALVPTRPSPPELFLLRRSIGLLAKFQLPCVYELGVTYLAVCADRAFLIDRQVLKVRVSSTEWLEEEATRESEMASSLRFRIRHYGQVVGE